MSATPDLLVVGAGPAGVSAALWAATLGLCTTVIEAGASPGGQLHHIHFRPLNLAGSAPGDGPAIAAALADQLRANAIETRCGVTAAALEPAAPAVRTASGERIAARAVLIATGVRRRRLDVPGERKLEGRGVSFSATQDRARFAGEDVMVAGGGDAAYENALILAEAGCRVTLVVRGRPRARREFRDRVAAVPAIDVLEATRITAISGDDRLRAVRLDGPRGAFELPAAGLVIKVGVIPNAEWLAGALERDPEGYVPVDEHCGTSQPRVWAAGEVTHPPLAGLAVAIGHGALAAAAIRTALRGE
ncbi:MAG: NAD(P)/FAD-dependent oxidoreductase [Candidatus Eisenbacteria bacterium]|nr:NAD(P)/FAD-dependent oxidoreductase [Candidatus Eisenbacteria bacterium]